MKSKSHDNIFARRTVASGDFAFDESVAAVFSDMIERSVPGYATMLSGITAVAERHITPGSHVYDLGCSQGAALLAAAAQIPYENCTLFAIDNSQAMLDRCRDNIAQAKLKPSCEIICDDLMNVQIENASMVIMNLTLQFIEASQRPALLANIFRGMLPGGALVIAEKTQLENAQDQSFMTELYYAFKRANGYSELEISRKRTALENVLVPETEHTHTQRLRECGFQQIGCWFHCFGFKALIAIK